jgi:hypothetical protein
MAQDAEVSDANPAAPGRPEMPVSCGGSAWPTAGGMKVEHAAVSAMHARRVPRTRFPPLVLLPQRLASMRCAPAPRSSLCARQNSRLPLLLRRPMHARAADLVPARMMNVPPRRLPRATSKRSGQQPRAVNKRHYSAKPT